MDMALVATVALPCSYSLTLAETHTHAWGLHTNLEQQGKTDFVTSRPVSTLLQSCLGSRACETDAWRLLESLSWESARTASHHQNLSAHRQTAAQQQVGLASAGLSSQPYHSHPLSGSCSFLLGRSSGILLGSCRNHMTCKVIHGHNLFVRALHPVVHPRTCHAADRSRAVPPGP